VPTLSSRRPPARAARPALGKPADGKPERKKPTWKETVRFWVVAILVLVTVRAFLFEPYRIPSESMEETLLVGDFLIVSKLHYGPRTPNTLGIPLTGIYLPGLQLPQTRLPGFSEVRRGDVVVFNYPASDDIVRGPIPASVPIERRDPYIKRIIGLPGDTLAVLDKVLHLNGRAQPLRPTIKQTWRVTSTGDARPSSLELEEVGAVFQQDVRTPEGAVTSPRQYLVVASASAAERLRARPDVANVAPEALPDGAVVSRLVFPPGAASNADQFGPVVVPGAGRTVRLDATTWPMYREVITRHEGHRAQATSDSTFLIDGRPATTYTFAQDYYFVMGDNRDNSVDGRYWGFVPENHLVGKAVFLFLSFERFLPPIPRLNRFFRTVK